MDSKYGVIERGNKTGASSISFSLKRKFTYGNVDSPDTNTPQAKRFNLQLNKPKNDIVRPASTPSAVTNSNGSKNDGNSSLNLQLQRKQLPIYGVKAVLMKHLDQNDTLIVIGETGSGKTTQIPQFLHQLGLSERGIIAITQPRRVAAITISTRVAKEMKCQLGNLVGYTVRFEDHTTKDTKIRFITDGSLLREALADRLLRQYSVIILDEAHERTINTDVLFGIVKEAQRARQHHKMLPLKVIIMSATMDVDHFSKYFSNCKTIYLVGRTFPVKVMHTKESQSDYLHASLCTLFQIHDSAPVNHDVLMFLTGQEEIEGVAQQIRSLVKSNAIKGPPLRVFPLYAQLAQKQQMDVFAASAPGTRKVILSTNIAETSLTIPGIKFVIDSGMVKRRVYCSTTGMDTLKVVPICKDQSWQRCGRAGRDSAGVCYRTYTLKEYQAMALSSVPEILRSNIMSTMLQLMAIGVDYAKFDFIDRPSTSAIEIAIRQLALIGAVKVGRPELTQSGHDMAKFPLDPKYSKMLLMAPSFGCLEEMLSLVSLLSGEDIFLSFYDNEKRVDAWTAHSKFENKFSDHLTLLNVFRALPKSERIKLWCHENYLNARHLAYALEVRSQLSDICKRLKLEFSSCGNNLDQVRKCLLSGLFVNLAELQRDNHYLTIASRQSARIHPSSVLNGKPKSQFVMFTELVTTGKAYMRNVTVIEADWIEEVVPNFKQLKKLYYGNSLS